MIQYLLLQSKFKTTDSENENFQKTSINKTVEKEKKEKPSKKVNKEKLEIGLN